MGETIREWAPLLFHRSTNSDPNVFPTSNNSLSRFNSHPSIHPSFVNISRTQSFIITIICLRAVFACFINSCTNKKQRYNEFNKLQATSAFEKDRGKIRVKSSTNKNTYHPSSASLRKAIGLTRLTMEKITPIFHNTAALSLMG